MSVAGCFPKTTSETSTPEGKSKVSKVQNYQRMLQRNADREQKYTGAREDTRHQQHSTMSHIGSRVAHSCSGTLGINLKQSKNVVRWWFEGLELSLTNEGSSSPADSSCDGRQYFWP
eukprot:scpid77732/ scgid26466/ 